jgi:two-component system response regulator HydG
VDDDEAMCAMLAQALGKRGFTVTTRLDAAAAFELLLAEDFEVLVTDLNLKGMSGPELCERVVANRRDVPVVVITAFGSMETAIAAIRAGAYDFVTKPIEMDALGITLERAVRHRALTDEVRRLRRAVADARGLDEMIGASRAMAAVYDVVTRVAETDATVLITGESGTGKELVARALHRRSTRADGPFVTVNCAAMPEPLLESELFGHTKGAFTDAHTARTGLFLQASGGTLFLDEIGELPMSLQPKLLRALQERKVRPVGADTELSFDARIVAATNADLEGLIEEKRFREDLYYRFNVVHVALPPLRIRGGTDILPLAQHFVETMAAHFGKQVKGISVAAAEKLVTYDWPGNVRELSNCIERAVALARFEELAVEDLPEKVRAYRPHSMVVVADEPGELVPMAEVERRYILKVLEAHGGSRTNAARTLGLDRKTLYRRLKAYGVDS